ncbi:unnamed protein product, partial [Discosporangium mesarthrocarpum]
SSLLDLRQEAWVNMGSLLRDWGHGKEALEAFNRALALDSGYVHAYHLRGLCKHSLGRHGAALEDFRKGTCYDGQDENCRYMAALCLHAMGHVEAAVRSYDTLLDLKPGHQAWYNRECCVHLWRGLGRPLWEFSPDAELDPAFKVWW